MILAGDLEIPVDDDNSKDGVDEVEMKMMCEYCRKCSWRFFLTVETCDRI